MTVNLLYSITGLLIFFMGICGLMFHRSLVRQTLALNIAGAGIFLFLVAQAYKSDTVPPDPVPHGLVLTGIVISASATALMLFLIGVHQSVSKSSNDEGERGS